MAKAFVLVTAMPPTTGHLQLIQFASLLASEMCIVLTTQPHEPFPHERAKALRSAIKNRRLTNVKLIHYTKTIEQNPAAPGFWEMWRKLMFEFGARPGDIIVASEAYGKKLAEICKTEFFPYDIGRELNPAKATSIRDKPFQHFAEIIPEFQPYLRTTVTIFGAESTGKTTLSRQLAKELNGHWLFEYARPYLENTVNEITVRSMTAIWKGQAALQKQARQNFTDKPFIVQDTDLFSTVGYWQFPHWHAAIGDCPPGLIADAHALKSDIYIITRSNIPFEQDPLRYGGDRREGSDEYWVNVCETNNLPHIVLNSNNPTKRLQQALAIVQKIAAQKAKQLQYDRQGL
jgi:HTH-type transcriptional regulator, transcriptional repressor of NAD biosynthesis genes